MLLPVRSDQVRLVQVWPGYNMFGQVRTGYDILCQVRSVYATLGHVKSG